MEATVDGRTVLDIRVSFTFSLKPLILWFAEKSGHFEVKILTITNTCILLRTVSISSRDPIWMTPLVKYMLRRKSRVSSDNQGSREWWRNDDVLSQRRCRSCFKLDDQMLQNLNNYFCDLCSHTDYIEPTLTEIRENCEVVYLKSSFGRLK